MIKILVIKYTKPDIESYTKIKQYIYNILHKETSTSVSYRLSSNELPKWLDQFLYLIRTYKFGEGVYIYLILNITCVLLNNTDLCKHAYKG